MRYKTIYCRVKRSHNLTLEDLGRRPVRSGSLSPPPPLTQPTVLVQCPSPCRRVTRLSRCAGPAGRRLQSSESKLCPLPRYPPQSVSGPPPELHPCASCSATICVIKLYPACAPALRAGLAAVPAGPCRCRSRPLPWLRRADAASAAPGRCRAACGCADLPSRAASRRTGHARCTVVYRYSDRLPRRTQHCC